MEKKRDRLCTVFRDCQSSQWAALSLFRKSSPVWRGGGRLWGVCRVCCRYAGSLPPLASLVDKVGKLIFEFDLIPVATNSQSNTFHHISFG